MGERLSRFPAASDGLRHLREGDVGDPHRHAELAAELGGEPHVLVRELEREAGGSYLAGRNRSERRSKVRWRPLAPLRTASHSASGSTPPLMPSANTSASAVWMA